MTPPGGSFGPDFPLGKPGNLYDYKAEKREPDFTAFGVMRDLASNTLDVRLDRWGERGFAVTVVGSAANGSTGPFVVTFQTPK